MTKRLFAVLRYTAVVAFIAGLFVMSGCKDDDKGPTQNIYDIIAADPTLSMIKAQVDLNADLKAKLQDPAGTYTFYAPNDLAMAAVLQTLGLTDFSSISPATLNAVLNYHLAPKVVMAADMTDKSTVTTAEGENITISVTSTGVIKLVTGATTNGTVITPDERATNGVVHVVGDYPLIPPTIGNLIVATLGKVAQPILLSSSFSILAQAILKADAGKAQAETIVGALVALPNVTFFAPPDAVFNGAGLTVASKTADEWNAIIRGHIVPQNLATLTSTNVTTINAKTLTLTATTVAGAGNAEPGSDRGYVESHDNVNPGA
ncbi:MAG: fasciclin domain-containing protein [Bacteroidota bacterium]